jgi:Zn finger protein HypA/HybF involved in hydrogenase expression
MFCDECNIEFDGYALLTRCPHCGGPLSKLDNDDDGQPDEQQEWADYDPDC